MRGRKPKDAAARRADGDTAKLGSNKHLERIASVPRGSRGLPECPSFLKGEAREAWEVWSDDLVARQIDYRSHAQLLAGACATWQTVVKAQLALNKLGQYIEKKERDDDGKLVVVDVKENPAIKVRERSLRVLNSLITEFGFSPVSQERIKSTADKGDSLQELAAMLSRPRAAAPLAN